jgi:crotonobetainyl-CoA:carnitine CoA-transferase CaiB-like acyl-CoA transferase
MSTPPVPLPLPSSSGSHRILEGIKVLELCRIIAGPTIGRILAEYGANVLKVTGPGLSDVPFFQVDGNMGKHATEIDLKSVQGKEIFERLLEDVDIVLDGYRPGSLDKLGYSATTLAKFAEKRGKGVIYVNENCFGYTGEWANRPGWQQIADCVGFNTSSEGLVTKILCHWDCVADNISGKRTRVGPRTLPGSGGANSSTLPDF